MAIHELCDAAGIAQRVRFYRKRRGMSAADLAKRCEAVGLPIKLNVLQKFEGGTRSYITVSEWLAIAEALEVPPLVLLLDLTEPTDASLHALSALRGDGPIDPRTCFEAAADEQAEALR